MGEQSLADVAAELYAGPPAEFVAARNERAKDAADPGLAAQIRALRKPSIAAWVVNVFAQERAPRLAQAMQLAAELRDAQEDFDAATLAQLGRQRRALTNQLAREAVSLATSKGERITPSTLDAVQQTIAAAFFDADAAAAVASGRLVRELDTGTPVDLEAAVGGGAPESAAEVAPPQTDEVKARRERREAEARVHGAEQELLRANRDRSKAEDDVRKLTDRIDGLALREQELESQLADLRDSLESARAALPDAAERQVSAETAVTDGEQAVEEARKALERLS